MPIRTINDESMLQMHRRSIKRMLRLITVGTLSIVSFGSLAEEYKFFISGFPADNNCSSLESNATALETSSLTKSSDAMSIDARYRSWKESTGIALRSDKYRFFGIVIR